MSQLRMHSKMLLRQLLWKLPFTSPRMNHCKCMNLWIMICHSVMVKWTHIQFSVWRLAVLTWVFVAWAHSCNLYFATFNYMQYIGFEVLTAVVMKSYIFWDVMSYSLFKVDWCSRGTCHHLQASGFLLRLFFDHEDGGDIFLWNVSCLSVDYMAFITIYTWTHV
jgi:hypothetical protein